MIVVRPVPMAVRRQTPTNECYGASPSPKCANVSLATDFSHPCMQAILQCVFATTPNKRWSLILHLLKLGVVMQLAMANETLAHLSLIHI